MTEETLTFQAETAKLLQIVANSLYSRREVFLRELISNASDACDRLRYEALTRPELAGDDTDFRVILRANPKARTLAIEDNGIGMSRTELIENLGTIARSGSSVFLEQLTGDKGQDMALIGQFGVGFYSAFIVSDSVDVISRKAGADEAWRWSSDGAGEFQVAEAERPERGTSIILHLKKEAKEFLTPTMLEQTVKSHSDHVGVPIILANKDGKEEILNSASALWTRPKNEITADQYIEFFRHISHGLEEPWMTIHVRAEGRLHYTMLLFIPHARPLDLFQPDRKSFVRLYVRRVFVTDDAEGLIPAWLRFLRGIIDTEDISLNVSREMLQHDPVLAKIGSAITKRVLSDLEKKAKKTPEEYAVFWENFGAVLKEGLYEDASQRDKLLGLLRFHSTQGDNLVSLQDYIDRMAQGQEAIYTISGDNVDTLRASPQLEGYTARGLEVLLLTDPVDDFWVPAVSSYQDKPFASVTRGHSDLDKLKQEIGDTDKDDKTAPPGDIAVLVALMKQTLGDAVQEVRASDRLTTSAVCLVADNADLDRHLAKMLKQHGQLDHVSAGVLEINARHPLIESLASRAKNSGLSTELEDATHLLLDQARIIEGDPPIDSAAFASRLAKLLEAV